MESLRILFASEFYFPLIGGAELAGDELLQALAARGHRVRALCGGEGPSLQHGRVEVVHIRSRADIEREIRDLRPQLILTQGHLAALVVGIAGAFGIPVWFYVHALDHVCPEPAEMARCNRDCSGCSIYAKGSQEVEAQKQAIRLADRVLVPSAYAKTEISAFTGRSDIAVLPPPTRLYWMDPSDDRPFITFVTAAPFKGLATWLELVRSLPDQRFLVVGRANPATWGVDLARLPNVTQWGVVPTERFLSVSKIVLVPSILPETFGRVVPEAQAAGALVVASRFGGLIESVGEGGVLVAPHTDPLAWVRALTDLLADSPRQDRLRAAGRKQAHLVDAEVIAGDFAREVEAQFGYSCQPMPLRWEGSQFVYHSLALVNRHLCLALLSSGRVELSLLPYEPDQFEGSRHATWKPLASKVNAKLSRPPSVHVRHQWPPNFTAPESGAWVIIQPWEFGGIPSDWVPHMRDQVDEIWVPSTWVRDCYIRSGLSPDQVVVVPNGVDGARFCPEGARYPLKTKKAFKFLFLGGTIHRKGIDVLLKAYESAFRRKDDVCLIIKGFGADSVYAGTDLEPALKVFRSDPEAPEVEYLTAMLSEPQIADLYRACDALIHPYRGEGFGLPIAEAKATGLTVIVTGAGACLDFCGHEDSYLIPSRRVPLQRVDNYLPTLAGFWLEEPDPEALSVLMQHVVSHPEEAMAKARLGRERILREFTWEKAAAIAEERMLDLSTREPRRSRFLHSKPGPGPLTFLLCPEWGEEDWIKALLAFLQAFRPGEPVLLLVWTKGTLPRNEAEALIIQTAMACGLESFADVAVIETMEELADHSARCNGWVNLGPGKNEGSLEAEVALRLRFNQAYHRS